MNNKIVSFTGFSFILLLTILVSFQSCVSPRNRSIKKWEKQEWKIVKVNKNEEPTWKIYTRKISGTNLFEYKIEGDIKSNPKVCISSFKQNLLNDASDSKTFSTYDIINESNDTILTYVIHKEPFPLKDTEMSIRYEFSSSKDASIGVKWKEAWDDDSVASSKKLSRVQTFRGSWHFSPISNNLSKAVNSVQFDPKKMPPWMFEPMIFKFLKEGLQDMRDLSSKQNLKKRPV